MTTKTRVQTLERATFPTGDRLAAGVAAAYGLSAASVLAEVERITQQAERLGRPPTVAEIAAEVAAETGAPFAAVLAEAERIVQEVGGW
jgi:hypothetical protein